MSRLWALRARETTSAFAIIASGWSGVWWWLWLTESKDTSWLDRPCPFAATTGYILYISTLRAHPKRPAKVVFFFQKHRIVWIIDSRTSLVSFSYRTVAAYITFLGEFSYKTTNAYTVSLHYKSQFIFLFFSESIIINS